ncbi:MAG: hypothetical protein WBE11_15515 [Candidatus Aminicenantaceae bacterium]|jgi:hypothetical protein
MRTAEWSHKRFEEVIPEFSIKNDFAPKRMDLTDLPKLRESYLTQAEQVASELEKQEEAPFVKDDEEIEELKSFYYIHRG